MNCTLKKKMSKSVYFENYDVYCILWTKERNLVVCSFFFFKIAYKLDIFLKTQKTSVIHVL